MEGTTMNRRAAIRSLSFAGGASLLASTPSVAGVLASRLDTGYAQAVTGTAPVKIRDIKAILTAPNRIRLVVVKIETTEPGLVGWGCATFTQRALVVQTARRRHTERNRRSYQPGRYLGAGAVRANGAEVIRTLARQARRRRRAPPRRARARDAESGNQSVQVARALSLVFSGRSSPAGRQRSFSLAAPANQHAPGHGRTLQHAARVRPPHQRAAD